MSPIYANNHICVTGDPIHFMFGYRVGFSWTADLMALFCDSNKFKMVAAAILDNFEWPYPATANDLLI